VWVQHSSRPDDHVIRSRSAPPPRAGPAVGAWRSGLSAISVSVVRIRPAIEAALRSANADLRRIDHAGSERSPNVPVRASSPVPAGAAPTRATTTWGSRPALEAMVGSGQQQGRAAGGGDALFNRGARRASSPGSSSGELLEQFGAAWQGTIALGPARGPASIEIPAVPEDRFVPAVGIRSGAAVAES
jgi:hypothetical protein